MIRIMHITQAAGGVERYLYVLLKKLDKKKYENILVCSQSYDIEKFRPFVLKIECIKMYREINVINEIKAIIQIRKIIKKYQPDIIYMHSSKAGAVSRIANIGFKNISIYNAHGWSFNMKCNPWKQNLYALIERILAPFCSQIVAISDYEKKSALSKGICCSNKIKVIYNGIDFDEYKQCYKVINYEQLGIPKDAYVIGCVGRLSNQKAPDIFVKAAKLIKEKISNAYFIMVGDGDERNKTEKLIKKLALENYFFITGWVDNPLEYIMRFDVAMLLSRWEGFGLVLPEFMLEGKPIVATNVDAIPNIIKDQNNGILVPMDDYKAASEAVIKIYKDIDFAKQLKENGWRCVYKRFNAERVAKEHDNLFKELLQNYR